MQSVMPLAGGQNLGVQLPLFQPGGGADYAHHITDYPPGFENLTTSLYCISLIPNIALQMSRTLIRNDKWWLKVIIMEPGILVRPQLAASASGLS